MKKIISIIVCLLLLASTALPVFATEQTETVYSEEIILEDGIVVKDEIVIQSQARSAEITATRTRTLTKGDSLVAEIAFQAKFRCDGQTVTVLSKSVTRTDTYNGWSYKQNSFTSSGGTVTLDAEVTKWLVINVPFTMSMTCDAAGNVTAG